MDIYLVFVLIIAGLAVSGLIVGVSNDAVNFLVSAVGSRAVTLKVALAVASVGIVIGTAFSGGMMEVARKGIFNPSQFAFYEVMIVFMAVMIANILLLDFFNTFGLPTSTTVSLVFALLGASVGLTIIKISRSAETLQNAGNYINSGRTLLIIAGILLSVIVAFTAALIVQFVVRLVFSFDYRKTIRYFGSVFGGMALASIVYFTLIEGAKGVTFFSAENIAWIQNYSGAVILITFLGGSTILQILTWLFNLNVFKFIILIGTGALALAFAGNDLVNFIGVPLAGYESYRLFSAAGGSDPAGFLMSGLQGQVRTPTIFLLAAGIIMVTTLYVSKKAKSVIKTSLSLSNQEETVERFESSALARSLVRIALSIGSFFEKILPARVLKLINKRLDPAYFKNTTTDKSVSFDLVRASVNLVVASVVITFGTSLKLPLSTTYVTFMVAMGTSLVDGAWSRETAVYRVNGMMTVIGGWFFTALIAFICAFMVAALLYYGGIVALIVMIALSLFLTYRTNALHNKRTEEFKKSEKIISDTTQIDKSGILLQCNNTVINACAKVADIYEKIIDGWIGEKRRKLKKACQDCKELTEEMRELQASTYYVIRKLQVEESIEGGHHYIQVVEQLRDVSEFLNYISQPVFKHVDNNHAPLKSHQIHDINEFTVLFISFINHIIKAVSGKEFDKVKIMSLSHQLLDLLVKLKKDQLKLIKSGQTSTRISMLYMDVLAESRNLVLGSRILFEDALALAEYSKGAKSLLKD
ncbi:MAG: inorganic phosphate transporter [Bacteroidales bacterium]|nr:inorganic phosphate transporter [Bacteroidales bacterium]